MAQVGERQERPLPAWHRARRVLALIEAPAALFAAFSLVTLVMLWLHEPLRGGMDTRILLGPFHAQNVWCFDHMMRVLSGEIPFSDTTTRIGFPGPVDLRLVAWVPAMLSLPLRAFMGSLGAYNLIFLLSPGLSTLATALFLRVATRASWWSSAGLALAYGLCPYILGTVANGQIEKLQHWNFPLTLLSFHLLLGRRWPLALVGLGLVTAAGVFTTPDTTIYLPFALGPYLIWLVWKERAHLGPTLLKLGLGCLLCAAILLLARSYYSQPRQPGLWLAFEPGLTVEPGRVPDPSPFAQPLEIVTGISHKRRQSNPELSNHVSYLGLPLLLFAALLSLRRFEGRVLGWVIALLGVVVSLGPRLVSGQQYVNLKGMQLGLPMEYLEALGYPTAESGMYYRAMAIGSLGLVFLIAASLAHFQRPHVAILLAWSLGLVTIADGYRASRPMWPRPATHVPAMGTYMEMVQDPVPGAVLALPALTTQYHGGRYLLYAVYHRRDTTGLSRLGDPNADSNVPSLLRLLREASTLGDPEKVRSFFFERGFRYAVWTPDAQNDGPPYSEFVTLLGEPEIRNLVPIWRFGD